MLLFTNWTNLTFLLSSMCEFAWDLLRLSIKVVLFALKSFIFQEEFKRNRNFTTKTTKNGLLLIETNKSSNVFSSLVVTTLRPSLFWSWQPQICVPFYRALNRKFIFWEITGIIMSTPKENGSKRKSKGESSSQDTGKSQEENEERRLSSRVKVWKQTSFTWCASSFKSLSWFS